MKTSPYLDFCSFLILGTENATYLLYLRLSVKQPCLWLPEWHGMSLTFCSSHLAFIFGRGSDDLTLIVWDTSADLTNSGSDDSAKWYILESSISLSGTFASIEFAAKRVNHTRVSTRCTLSCHSLCSIFSQETSNHHIGISRPDNFFR